MNFLRKFFFFKSVIQGVFWKDNAKGFPNQLSKIPLHISKLVEIILKDTQHLAVLAKFNK